MLARLRPGDGVDTKSCCSIALDSIMPASPAVTIARLVDDDGDAGDGGDDGGKVFAFLAFLSFISFFAFLAEERAEGPAIIFANKYSKCLAASLSCLSLKMLLSSATTRTAIPTEEELVLPPLPSQPSLVVVIFEDIST